MKNNTLLFGFLCSNSLPSAAYKITLAEKITVNAKSIQKRFLLMPLMVLGFLFTNGNLWGQAGFFGGGTAGMVTYSLNGAGDVNSWNWNTNIGSARSLILKGGYAHTYKGANGNVCNAKIFYRVYPNGSPSGSFTQLPTMSFNANHTFSAVTATPSNISSSNSGDQRWIISGQTIDLTALATSRGTWVLEVYFQADGSTTSNSVCNTNALIDNNNVNNYKILFDKEINPGFEVTPVTSNGWTLESGSTVWSTAAAARSGSVRLSLNCNTGNIRKAEHKSYSVQVPASGTNYVHVIGYGLEHTNEGGTDYSYVGAMSIDGGTTITGSTTATPMTVSWQRMVTQTGASSQATNGKIYYPVIYVDGDQSLSGGDYYAFDDVIIYTSTSSGPDITKPNAPSGLTITRTSTGNNLSWTDGTDVATNTSGIEGTLILRTTTDKTAAITNLSNALLNQAYYSTTSTLGPTTISDGTNTWTVVSNGTSSGSYTDTGAATNVTYVVVMRDKAFNYSAGVAAFSHCVNPTAGGTIATAQTICLNGDPAAFTSSGPATGHTGTLEYKWQSSTTSSSAGFSDIGGATSDTYDAGAISQTTWYKRLARVSCMSDWTVAAESNVLKVSVDESNSAASTYNGGWFSGQDDGATGFNSWVIPAPSGNAGHGTASAGSDINSSDGDSWFMFADGSGALSQATRPLASSMSVGNTLTFHIDNGGVVGTVGFSLRRSGANLMELYFVGGGSFYTLNDGTSTITTNIPYTTSGLRVAITYTNASSPGAYSITVTNLSDGKNYFYSNRSFFTVSGVAPNEIRFFNSNAGAFSNFYINRLSLNRPVINSETNFATQTICSSATAAELSVTASGTGLSYKWYQNTSATTSGATDTGVTSSNYTPPSTIGTRFYYCVVAGTCSSVQSNYAQVTVNDNPTATTAGPDSVCQSASPAAITLTGASVGGGATTGAWSITSGSGTLSSTAQTTTPANVTYTPAANFSGTVTLLLTSNFGTGCTAATSIRTINVNPLTTPTFTAVGPFCSGAVISALPTTSNNGIEGTWSPAIDNTTTTTYTFTPTSSASPTCATTTTLTITINPLPTPTISGTLAFCADGSTTLDAGAGYSSYSWSNFATTQTTSINTAGSFSVTVTNSNGCSGTSPTVTTTVNNLSTTPTGATGTTTIASGTGTTLTVNGGSQGTGAVTQWYTGSCGGTLVYTGDVFATGNLSSTTTYYVRYSGTCNNTTCATVTVTVTSSSNVWTAGAGTTVWTTAGNWSSGIPTSTSNVVIASASFYPEISSSVSINTLTLNSGTTLKVNTLYDLTVTDVITNNGTLTLENNANLIQVNDVVNTGSGPTVVKRNSSAIMRFDYTLWSSPLSGQGLYAFSPFTFANRFYEYNTSSNTYSSVTGFNITGVNGAGVNGIDNNNVQFSTGLGYLIRMPYNHPTAPAIWTGTFTGTPNNGDKTVALNNTSSGLRYNLVGNPYPSPLDAVALVTDTNNAANITGTLYFLRKTNSNINSSYSTWTTGGFVTNDGAAVFDPNDVIQTGQGFFVETTVTGSALEFNNSMRINDHANQFFRSNNTIERNRIWLNATNTSGLYSQTMVGYITNATNDVDNSIDGKYLYDGNIALTSLIGSTPYAIQGRALPFDNTDVVPLNFRVTSAGQYSIAIDHVDGLFVNGTDVFLRDNLSSVVHNLNTGAYTFASDAGTFDSRFEILYQMPLGVTSPVFNANQVIIYKNSGNDFVINSGNVVMATVKVFDIRGRLLQEYRNVNASQTTISVGLANEMLLIQITSQDDVTVVKKVVR